MEIKEVHQNWPDDLLRVDITLGNYCNYKCWYCWPGCNSGTHKWPDFDTFVKNLSFLLDYYLEHTNKRRFDFHIMGGEITHWPKFFKFLEYFKSRYDVVMTTSTNASRTVEWWATAAQYLDYVIISSHHEYCDPKHIREVADLLYEKNVILNVSVLMDPRAWDKCLDAVSYYKKSKHRWSIRYVEVIHNTIAYSDEQKKLLGSLRARHPNLWWFFRNNKSYRSKVSVVDLQNRVHKVNDQRVILDRMNNFKGWDCSAGVDWVAIKMDGALSAICSNKLYNSDVKFNLFSEEFIEQFAPTITSTVCTKDSCWCMFEANMPKKIIFLKKE